MELLKNCVNKHDAKEWLKINGYTNETEINNIISNWLLQKISVPVKYTDFKISNKE